MATVINNPGTGTATSDTGGGLGFLIGMVVLLLVVIAFFYYGVPALRSAAGGGGGGATGGSSGAEINVPDKVDVNVNRGSGQGQ